MAKLPPTKPKKAIKAIQKAGFFLDHVSGSHYILYDSERKLRVSIPYHSKPLKRKTLSSILKQAQLTVEEFKELM